ncbi:MAG: S8 family serine peptidase [Anaerolineae bacterium]
MAARRRRAQGDRTAAGAGPAWAARRDIACRQAPAVRAVEAIGGHVVGQFQSTMNALQVHCTPDQLARIAKLPGVVTIAKAPIHTVDNKDVGPWTGATKVASLLGWDGKDSTIAIIDTGIDYTHKDFGGSGDPADFSKNDPDTIEPGSFPTAKVIGGYDLAGQYYSPACQQATDTCWQTPQPDDDLIDSSSESGKHGTHVAGTAAGVGTDLVGKGMAPGANLVAVKVFGSPIGAGSTTDLALQGLEWVYNNNKGLDNPDSEVPGFPTTVPIDVVNMSLGSDYGAGTAEYAEVVSGLHSAGVTVVASAGNSGNLHYITGSPSATEMILSVANTFAAGEVEQLFRATWTEGGAAKNFETGYVGDSGWLPAIKTPLLNKDMAYFGKACGTNAAEPFQDVNEKLALIERGDCAFTDKVRNAQAKGAIGVVIFTNANPKTVMGPTGNPPFPTIPAVMIDRDRGLEVQTLLQNGTPVKASIDPTKNIELPWLTDTIASSSSRGPARATGGIKPNISAPGQNTFSALAGSGVDGVSFSGTSMAGPAVAGIVALLAQRNRVQDLGMGAADLAALAMNYAQPVIRLDRNDSGPMVGVTRQGAGRVDALASAKGSVLIRSDRGLAELSLGDVNTPDGASTIERELTVRNLTDKDKTYKLSSMFAFPDEDADKGLAVSFPDPVITLHANDELPVKVHFDLTPAKMRPWELLGLDGMSGAKEPIFRTHEIDGYIVLTETDAAGAPKADGEVAHVPFHSLPHRRACVVSATNDDVRIEDTTTTVDQRYTHQCQAPGQMFAAYLGGTDAAESAQPGSAMPAAIDIGAVGVNTGQVAVSDGQGGTQQVGILQFTIATQGARRTPARFGFTVYVDADMDGTWDSMIFPLEENAVSAQGVQGRFVVAWTGVNPVNLQPAGQLSAAFLLPYDIGESVTTFAVPSDALVPGSDVAKGDVKFSFGVTVRDVYGDYPQNGTWLGDDKAPDKLVEGEGFMFEMADFNGRTQLTDPTNGLNLLDVGVGIQSFPGGASSTAKIGNRCQNLESDITTGILSVFRANMPDTAAWQVRRVTIGPKRAGPICICRI